jgi:type II secretory pathway pseudopilin PulG
MAALLVAMAVMAILMGAALPVWRHEAQREKEAELVFRGEQYVRALRLYQSRTQTLPNSVDLLVNGHFLRKKYKDPVTGQDFELIGSGGVQGQPAGGPAGAVGGRAGQPQQSQPQQSSSFGGTISGGILGVRSKSKEESIRLYQGRNHYNEWTFIYVQQNPGRGGPQGGPQRGGPQRGGPQGGPQRGNPGTFQPPGGFRGGGFPGGGFPGPGGAGPGRNPGGGPGGAGGNPIQNPGGGRRGGGSS